MKIDHYILHNCRCPDCGKTAKAALPDDVSTGYGPRLCALVAELSGIKAMSRLDVNGFCESVLNIPISTGTIQKIIDRVSKAIAPSYVRIGQVARSSHCNYMMKLHGSMRTIFNGYGPWSTRTWHTIVSIPTDPKKHLKD
jgi:transposase